MHMQYTHLLHVRAHNKCKAYLRMLQVGNNVGFSVKIKWDFLCLVGQLCCFILKDY